MAVPNKAATTGRSKPSMSANKSWYLGAISPVSNSFRSAPEMKVRPAQVMSTAPTDLSPASLTKASHNPCRTGCDIALTGGLSIVMTATAPSDLTDTTSPIAIPP